ncbi:MAG: hypothetical protein RJA59_1173, partial [Pseudomonadota bacterium]
ELYDLAWRLLKIMHGRIQPRA